MNMKTRKTITKTTGREQLGEFAPLFAHLNDDVLFGEVWNSSDLDDKTRTMLTVCSLVSQGITDSSLVHHLRNARQYGVTQSEMAGLITHIAMYAGWPKAWAAFRLAKDVYDSPVQTREEYQASIAYDIGVENMKFAPYFRWHQLYFPGCSGRESYYL